MRLVALLLIGCSSSSSPEAPSADTGVAIDSVVMDTGDEFPGDTSDAAKSCVPDTFHPPHARDPKCTPTELGELYDNCLAPTSSTGLCSAWRTTHAACFNCYMTDANAMQQGAVTIWNDTSVRFIDINTGGCLSATAGDSSDSSCGAKWDAWTRCAIGRCCAVTPFAAFQTCVSGARTNECKDLKSAYDACLPTVTNGKMCTPAAHSTPRELFVYVGQLLCAAM